MRVDGIPANAIAAQTKTHTKHREAPVPAEDSAPDPLEPSHSEDETKGVIRLLQEGHFKGVAEARLRINFFNELQTLEGQQLNSDAQAGFEVLDQSIKDPIDALKESGELTEEQRAAITAFLENVHEIQGGFLMSDNRSIEDLINDLQGEFDTLSDRFVPPATESPAEEQEPTVESEVPIDPAAEEPAGEEPTVEEPAAEEAAPIEDATGPGTQEALPENALSDIFASLQESFQHALGELQSGLTGSGVLPGISEPSGSGRAFEKFMAIYDVMKNDAPDQSVLVDELVDSPSEGGTASA